MTVRKGELCDKKDLHLYQLSGINSELGGSWLEATAGFGRDKTRAGAQAAP